MKVDLMGAPAAVAAVTYPDTAEVAAECALVAGAPFVQTFMTAASPGTGLDHMPSYWTATVGTIPPDDGPLAGNIDIDVAIIGGGYTGLSCAYHLARQYGIRTTVLEANRPGWGCSGRNGGFARAAIGRHSYAKMIDLWGRTNDQANRGLTAALGSRVG